jgi:5-methyltetrahydrofolate--homocysteine methyltransferase
VIEKNINDEINNELGKRILVLDGAIGTEIQALSLASTDFNGKNFSGLGNDLTGNNDVLNLTTPEAIKEIHLNYLHAGADIITTNTFNATTISQADYGMEEFVGEINITGAKLAREACEQVAAEDPMRKCWVAGALGPTNKTASISPDVNDPSYRAVSFDALRKSYSEAASALLEGGIDLFLIETIFDTLNAKACIFALLELFDNQGESRPIMISGTITDLSGRTLSGQTTDAFWYSVRHANPISIGLNCALGAAEMEQHIAQLSQIADTHICAYPNAGLPNEFGGYDETPETTASFISDWARRGLLNIVGGCCGTTPSHIAAIRDVVDGIQPRNIPQQKNYSHLSGLEALVIQS